MQFKNYLSHNQKSDSKPQVTVSKALPKTHLAESGGPRDCDGNTNKTADTAIPQNPQIK